MLEQPLKMAKESKCLEITFDNIKYSAASHMKKTAVKTQWF